MINTERIINHQDGLDIVTELNRIAGNTTRINALSSRVDEFTQLAEGSTTGDAELIDGRIGFNGVVHPNIGGAIRNQVSDLNSSLNNRFKFDGYGYEPDRKNTYHGTHFFKFDFIKSITAGKRYRSDDTFDSIPGGSSIIYKCPRYLGWYINHPSTVDIGTARLYLYILKIENDSLVLDTDFIFATTGSGIYNYLNGRQNKFIEVPDNRYFYFAGFSSENVPSEDVYTIIGCDEWIENDLVRGAYTDWACNVSGSLAQATGCSMFIPEGSFYAIHPDDYISGYDVRVNYVDTEASESKGKPTFYPSFGYVAKGEGFALFRRTDNANLNNFKIYISSEEVITPTTFPSLETSERLADKYSSKFEWVAKNNTITIAHARRGFVRDKQYYGVPYSSRWHDAHSIYFEVTPETFYNAVNDPYSIFYDNSEDRSVLPSTGGPGYGLVCSSFGALCIGSDYPQSNCGFFWDENFETRRSNNFNVGDLYNDPEDHCTYVSALLKNGYVLHESISPCCSKTVRTGTGDYIFQGSKTKINYLKNYGYQIHIHERAGFNEDAHVYDDFDFEIANGPVRPWRGNKCVYGSWDVSENGKGIWATIHDDSLSEFKILKPDGNVVTVPISSGQTVVSLTAYVDIDGIYELYAGNYEEATIEYFKFIDHAPITYSINKDGSVVFSSDDAEYCYAFVDSMPDKYASITGFDVNAVVLANTSKHPFAKYPNIEDHLLFTSACLVYDEWGKYAVPCTYQAD